MPATHQQPRRTPRDGIEYMPSSRYPESRSHNHDTPFPNDLIAYPDAMTDVHAHVLVNDLIRLDWSIEKLADAWHITHANAKLLVSLPIVQREIESYRFLCDLRNSLLESQRRESSLRTQLRILELPLLDRDEPGYTCHAANARANLLRLTAMRVLSDRSPRGSSPRAASSTPFHSSPPRSSHSSAASAFSSSDFSIHIPTERSPFDAALESRACASNEARARARASLDTTSNPSTSASAPQPIPGPLSNTPSPNPHTPDTTNTRVACLLEEQASSDDSRACPEPHACAIADMPPDTAPSDSSASSPSDSLFPSVCPFLSGSPDPSPPLHSPPRSSASSAFNSDSSSRPSRSTASPFPSSLHPSESSASLAFSYPTKRARDHPAR